LRLDFILLRLNIVDNIFKSRDYIKKGLVRINRRKVNSSKINIKPFQKIEFCKKFELRREFISKLLLKRAIRVRFVPFPKCFEYNFKLFSFMTIPLRSISKSFGKKFFRRRNRFLGLGKQEII